MISSTYLESLYRQKFDLESRIANDQIVTEKPEDSHSLYAQGERLKCLESQMAVLDMNIEYYIITHSKQVAA